MPKIIIKHLTGTKANQLESFELPFDAITFGRNTNCQVNYDPEKEDLVSRNHLKITPQGEDAFLLTDLNSSNGTFVNDKQVTEPVTLNAGDTVQLGKGGPKFIFELDPPPAAKKTREAGSFSDSKSTRENERQAQSGETRTKTAEPKKQGIGHETLERRIHETETTTRRKMINISAGIFTVIALVVGYFVYQGQVDKQEMLNTVGSSLTAVKSDQDKQLAEMKASASMSAADISRLYGSSTVLIETSWKLIHVQTGKQIGHKKDCHRNSKNACITDPKEPLPVYIYIADNDSIEPFLDLESDTPIGGSSIGSGFVVQENGFILTNRHVATGWHTSYTKLPLPGIIRRCADNGCKDDKQLADKEHTLVKKSLSKWVPIDSKMLGGKLLQGKNAEGRNDYLDITFPRTNLRVPARLARISDTADVALIKVDVPQALHFVQMDATTPVSAGEQITVMGYPEISPNLFVKVDSQDPFNRKGEVRIIPEPTITTGNIGKVLNSSANITSDSISVYISEMGDAYQLTVNATGAGNSGGPVFNDKGRVIGIFTSMKQEQGTIITFAVPIAHGLDIMGIQKAIE
ncbi:MAG: trypsin-like peptidase domain-containing protein [Nitrosomonas sp.]|uniref:trypsin-like peptidase domain-containing protein n=1 Tax=Nitrosomonas sp. TaxID=42353 RepID=UPI0027315002|nr:trypsin-like peptidase domain-containing protein [Nitrosomonas sp.]MDP1550073.1 trypsin-like peptidase domain-containing protein [Nitrosomonas sp.]